MKNTRTRIKVCGITKPEDALYVADCGVDAIGLVFYDKSPRAVTLEQAQEIIAALPAFVSTVGLFVNAETSSVQTIINALPLDLLQFHGDEPESYCLSFSKPYLKALRVKPEMNLAEEINSYSKASGILLDAWHKDIAGGTGEQFDWDLLQNLKRADSMILAGGLKASNIAEAIRQVQPYAVDVSSGVESAPGVKSRDKIKQFVDAVMAV